jgi:hypothetical protein
VSGCFQSQVLGIGPQIGFLFPVGDVQGYPNLKAYVHGFNPRSFRHALAALAGGIVGAQMTSNFQNWPGWAGGLGQPDRRLFGLRQ